MMASNTKNVASELLPLLRVYTNGTVERLGGSPYVLPTPHDPATGVASKDISISAKVSARLYLPKLPHDTPQLPILIYFRRGFCVGSAFSLDHHRYLNLLVSQSNVLAVSVEYRIAPEHSLPVAYEDSWAALQWVSSHAVRNDTTNIKKDPWLVSHADFTRLYIGGDTTGANIAHNISLRASVEQLQGNVKILGVFLCQPFFWGSKPIKSEPIIGHLENMICRAWKFVYPSAPGGIDNPMINPFVDGAPSLSGLGCSRLLVFVGEKEVTRERGIHYCDAVRLSGWEGEVELYEIEGGSHGVHFREPESEVTKNLIKRLSTFLQ